MRRASLSNLRTMRALHAVALGALTAGSLAACEFKSPDDVNVDPAIALASETTPEPTPAPATTESAEGTVTTPTFVVPENVSYEVAEGAFIDRRYDEAKAMFEVYSNNRPENPWGHYMFGLSSWKSGDHLTAVDAFEEALSLDPRHVKSMLNLGRVLLELERADEALAIIDAARNLDSTSVDVHRLLGRAYGELGRTEEAIESYRRAIVLDEKDVWSMNNMGLALIRAGRYEEALPPLARAVELRSDEPIFRNNFGVALERTGHFTLAAESYRKAVELDSTYMKASVSFTRVEGRVETPETTPLDVTELARSFEAEVTFWKGLESPIEPPVEPPVEIVEPAVVLPPGC